jgi:hypothetical protein
MTKCEYADKSAGDSWPSSSMGIRSSEDTPSKMNFRTPPSMGTAAVGIAGMARAPATVGTVAAISFITWRRLILMAQSSAERY